MNTGKLTVFFRYLGLIHLVDKFKFYFYSIKNRKVNLNFKKQYPEVVLPPDYMMFEAFQLNYEKYFIGGSITAKFIKDEAESFIKLESINILDWGCGPARVIRHLPKLIGNNCQFFGTDYNPNTIKWCSENIKGIDFKLNYLEPPLAYENSLFELIYGISIFTHLSEKRHYEWFQELMRVSKSGAVLLLTSHGEVFKSIMTEKEINLFEEGKLITRSNAVEGHRVYAAFHPIQFMRSLFEKECDILKHEPGKKETWGMSQDLWIIRKK